MTKKALVAPILPDGFFFRVRLDREGDTRVEIRRKRWLHSPIVDWTYTAGRASPTQVFEMMEKLGNRYKIFGDYPPKRELQ